MELKYNTPFRFSSSAAVLIVPLWNWNKDGINGTDGKSAIVLIVPLWNWNMIDIEIKKDGHKF